MTTRPTLNEIDLQISPTVRQAIYDFAAALAESPQFVAFEEAAGALRNDEAAQHALEAYQVRQRSLQMMLMLNAVSEDERAELERLRQAVLTNSTFAAYAQAQEDLQAVCRAAADRLSEAVGLSFAAVGGSCCG